jgi:hypothetical protein
MYSLHVTPDKRRVPHALSRLPHFNNSLHLPKPQMSSTKSPPTSPLPKRQKPNPGPSPVTSNMAAPAVTDVSSQPPLLIKKLSDKARLPTRGSAFAAGYDIYAAKDTLIPARGKALVDTELSMAVPAGTCAFALLLACPFPPVDSRLTRLMSYRWQDCAPLRFGKQAYD